MEKGFFSKGSKVLPKYLEKEVIIDILDRAKKDSYRNYIIILTLWRSGLRVSELTNIKKKDLIDDTLIVRQGKGRKDRVIPLETELNNLLGLYSDRLGLNDRLFSISARQIRNILNKYSPSDINVYPHKLRHSFAVYCLKNNMNLRSLQLILGHKSLDTTSIYLDLVGKDLKEDFKKVIW
jgi:site-specific recombinase XerD